MHTLNKIAGQRKMKNLDNGKYRCPASELIVIVTNKVEFKWETGDHFHCNGYFKSQPARKSLECNSYKLCQKTGENGS